MKIKSFTAIVATCTILCHWDAFGCGGGVFMKEIQLTQGYVALIDDIDYELVSAYKWYAAVYKRKSTSHLYVKPQSNVVIDGKRKTILMHHVIAGNNHTDHADGNPLNNQRSNLRACSNAQNQHNKIGWSKSGYKGVGIHLCGLWQAYINVNGKQKYVGLFKTKEDAAMAYNEAATRYFGKFAKLNIISP